MTHHVTAAMKAEAGIVRIQAQTIRSATPQRTADNFVEDPTPMIDPEMVCVVEIGMPRAVAKKSVVAPAVSAQNPPTGFNFVILSPIVFTILHPPKRVPSPMAAWQLKTIQSGT